MSCSRLSLSVWAEVSGCEKSGWISELRIRVSQECKNCYKKTEYRKGENGIDAFSFDLPHAGLSLAMLEFDDDGFMFVGGEMRRTGKVHFSSSGFPPANHRAFCLYPQTCCISSLRTQDESWEKVTKEYWALLRA